MRVNFNVMVKDFDGKDSNNNLARVLSKNIFFLSDGKLFQLSYDDKYKAYKIGQRIAESVNQGEIEITTEEASLIKQIASVVLTIGGFGQVVELIEGK